MTARAWCLDYDKIPSTEAWWLEKSAAIGGGYPVMYHFYSGMWLANFGDMSRAMTLIDEGARLADLNEDGYYGTRLPNLRGNVHYELGDYETAIELDNRSVTEGLAQGFDEAAANGLVNVGRDHMALGEHDNALECFRRAEGLFQSDIWFRWRYYIRLQGEYAGYWIKKGDLAKARVHAAECVERATAARARKHTARGNKLLGDVAALEDNHSEARASYAAAIVALEGRRCPVVEWKIYDAHARIAADGDAHGLRAAAKKSIEIIATGVTDTELRNCFVGGESVRMLLR